MKFFWSIRKISKWLVQKLIINPLSRLGVDERGDWLCFIEYCDDCGKKQLSTFHSNDELWTKIYACPCKKPNCRDGVLCDRCFERRAKKLGMWIEWEPKVIGYRKKYVGGRLKSFPNSVWDK